MNIFFTIYIDRIGCKVERWKNDSLLFFWTISYKLMRTCLNVCKQDDQSAVVTWTNLSDSPICVCSKIF